MLMQGEHFILAWIVCMRGRIVCGDMVTAWSRNKHSRYNLEVLLADKGYDCKRFADQIEERGANVCIPSRKNCKVQRDYDRHLYKERNLVERFFNLLKQFRRIATRYEKTAGNYLAMAHFAYLTF